MNDRRKLRRQTSDNMDRWKTGRKSQRRERKKKEDQRRERVRRKKMQGYEKVEKSRNTVFFTHDPPAARPAQRISGSADQQISGSADQRIMSADPVATCQLGVGGSSKLATGYGIALY